MVRRNHSTNAVTARAMSLSRLTSPIAIVLALQLHFRFDMRLPRNGLMGASPERPCDHPCWVDALLGETGGDAPDFLDRPTDQCRVVDFARRVVFGGGAVT